MLPKFDQRGKETVFLIRIYWRFEWDSVRLFLWTKKFLQVVGLFWYV